MAPQAAAPPRPEVMPPRRDRRRCEQPRPGRFTLAERLAHAAAELDAAGRTACPLCAGELDGARAGATCRHCGTRLF